MAYPRFQMAREFKFASRTAGNVTTASTSFVAIDTGTDITLRAAVGDVIEGCMMLVASCAATASGGAYNFATIISGTVVNNFTTAADGVGRTFDPVAGGGNLIGLAARYLYTVQIADISLGTVTVRALARQIGAAATLTIYADGTNRIFQFSARNLGPADPN